MTDHAHTHPCSDCRTPVDCPGELSPNWDGFPETLCSEIHRPGGYTERVLCESCNEAREAQSRAEALA